MVYYISHAISLLVKEIASQMLFISDKSYRLHTRNNK